MILDSTNLFSDQQAVTADAASTNTIDLGTPGTVFSGRTQTRDVGPGTTLHVWAICDVTFLTIVSMNIVLRTDDNTSFSSPTIIWTSRLFLLAEMVAGFRFRLPHFTGPTEQYVQLYYDVNTSATAGKVTAGLSIDNQLNPTG